MRASKIATAVPTVTLDESVAHALSSLADHRLPGLIVVDDAQRPVAVLPGTQVLKLSIEFGYREDAALARTVDEGHADIFWRQEGARLVRDCCRPKEFPPAIVHEDATLLEVAALMARSHCPLVAVVDRDGVLLGGITLTTLLNNISLPLAPAQN